MANSELACVYAALILADDGVEVTVSECEWGGRHCRAWHHMLGWEPALEEAASSTGTTPQCCCEGVERRPAAAAATASGTLLTPFAPARSANPCLPAALRLTTSPP